MSPHRHQQARYHTKTEVPAIADPVTENSQQRCRSTEDAVDICKRKCEHTKRAHVGPMNCLQLIDKGLFFAENSTYRCPDQPAKMPAAQSARTRARTRSQSVKTGRDRNILLSKYPVPPSPGCEQRCSWARGPLTPECVPSFAAGQQRKPHIQSNQTIIQDGSLQRTKKRRMSSPLGPKLKASASGYQTPHSACRNPESGNTRKRRMSSLLGPKLKASASGDMTPHSACINPENGNTTAKPERGGRLVPSGLS